MQQLKKKTKFQKNSYSMQPFMQAENRIYKNTHVSIYLCKGNIRRIKQKLLKAGYLQEVVGNGVVRTRKWEKGIRNEERSTILFVNLFI